MGLNATFIDRLRELIDWLETTAVDLPSLPDVSDANMALMYLRHIERHLTSMTPPRDES